MELAPQHVQQIITSVSSLTSALVGGVLAIIGNYWISKRQWKREFTRTHLLTPANQLVFELCGQVSAVYFLIADAIWSNKQLEMLDPMVKARFDALSLMRERLATATALFQASRDSHLQTDFGFLLVQFTDYGNRVLMWAEGQDKTALPDLHATVNIIHGTAGEIVARFGEVSTVG